MKAELHQQIINIRRCLDYKKNDVRAGTEKLFHGVSEVLGGQNIQYACSKH